MGDRGRSDQRKHDKMGPECGPQYRVCKMGKNMEENKIYTESIAKREHLQNDVQVASDPTKIAIICKKNYNPMCWKCKKEIGTYFHMWWTCQMAKNTGLEFIK